MHKLEQNPIPEELEALVETPKTRLYLLMSVGLLMDKAWNTFGEMQCVLGHPRFSDGDGAKDLIDCLVWKFLSDKANKGAMNDAQSQLASTFMQALKL